MPTLNQYIKITDKLKDLDIDEIEAQEASKFMLRCMKGIPTDHDDKFTYGNLIIFMRDNMNNSDYYKGNYGLKSKSNIWMYWRYAHSVKHSAQIPDIRNYYEFC
tara:strand:+ start:97 stop:408 length:312 start_codon:yes stop_codon:yes gene_type:complete